MYQIHNCSPNAESYIAQDIKVAEERAKKIVLEEESKAVKYPFKKMQIGHCFLLPVEVNKDQHSRNLQAAYTAVAKANKALKPKQFKTFSHPDCIEVARIA